MDIKINLERLKTNILELAEIGKDPNGGISRPSFSTADLEAREWLKDKIACAGFCARQDGAGNIFGRKEGEGKTVMAGSHIDSVLNGGIFDGPAGVLSALECLQTIQEKGIKTVKPLEIAAFTDEEGNLIGDFLGALAFIGAHTREDLEKGRSQFGLTLAEILKNTEFSIDSILTAHQERPEIEAFLELHIEQGTVLETEDKSIGIVDCVAGKNYRQCSFVGRAGHAGTTPFELRQDAFLGLADFALKGTQYVATTHYGSKMTIGKAVLYPGAFSIVPGRTDFTLDIRSTSLSTLLDIEKTLLAMAEDIAATRGLEFYSQVINKTDPLDVPLRLQAVLKDICEKSDYSYMTMPSGAGHDAQILSAVTDSAIIFIPCEDGISHSPQENIKWEDLERGANVLLQAIIRLAN